MVPPSGVGHFTQDRRRQAAVELRQSRAEPKRSWCSKGIAMRQEAKLDEDMRQGRRTVSLRPVAPLARDAGREPQIHSRADRASSRPRSSTTSTSSRSSAATACAASRCSRRSRIWDDLTFLPGTLTRFVIEGYREKCETKTVIGPRAKRPMVLDIPVYVTGMSFGALSYRGEDRARPRRHHGGLGHLLGRRRHDPRRAALFDRSGSISASSRATASTRTICVLPMPASSSSARAARSGSAAI